MKLYLSLLGFLVCSLVSGTERTNNLLAIYLVVDKIPHEGLRQGTIKPDGIQLIPEPVLTDADFVGYDRNNHTIEITPRAAKRLAKQIARKQFGPRRSTIIKTKDAVNFLNGDCADEPFVLVACGKPVYVGVFKSMISSSSYRVPTLGFAGIEKRKRLRVVSFLSHYVREEIRVNGERITRPDVRSHPIVLEALNKLGL